MSAARKMQGTSETTNPLGLPRILCLHGGGTNAKIFQAQCRVIARRLAFDYRLCFAEAPFPSVPGPDVVSVYRDCGPFKAWIRSTIATGEGESEAIIASLRCAIETDDARGATGPWVGLLGFSQGAKICASLLFHQQQNPGVGMVLFGRDLDFGVLLAGRGPLLSFASDGSSEKKEDTEPLRIPTIHVHGLKDPGLVLHRNLLEQFCDDSSVRLVEWDGAHRLPIKTADVEIVVREMLEFKSCWERIERPALRDIRVDSGISIKVAAV